MKMFQRMIAGLLALAVLASFSPKVQAQNSQNSLTLYSIAAPQLLLNGIGTNYGQVGNISSTAWFVGAGTTQTTNGTPALTWNTNAHIALGGGTKPATSTCNSNVLNTGSTDAAGSITFTGGSQAACTLTFTNAYAAAPFCVASDMGGTVAVQANASTTTLILTIASAANVTLNYICIGQ